MSGSTFLFNRNSPSPEQATHCVDSFFSVRPFGDDGASIVIKPEAVHSPRAFLFPALLHDVVVALSEQQALRRVVLDLSDISMVPDNARGSLVQLILNFSKRDGAVLCGASDRCVNSFTQLGIGEMFSQVERVRLPAADRHISEVVEGVLNEVDNLEFTRNAELTARTYSARPLAELKYNGQLIKYRVEGDTAVLNLNPEILSLEEERTIAEKLADSVRAVADATPEARRILLNLRGLVFMGADPMAAIITLHRAGKREEGKPLAVCCLGDIVAEKFSQTRLDRLVPTFKTEAEALDSKW